MGRPNGDDDNSDDGDDLDVEDDEYVLDLEGKLGPASKLCG